MPIVWQSNSGVVIPAQVKPTVDFPVGTHTVTLTVTDDDGATATASVVITVQPAASGGDGRTSDGLVALYTFQGGSGATVVDVAPSGSPLNLTIADPSQVSWLPGGGLAVNGPTLLASSGPASKIINACQASNELTLEAWITPRNVTQDGPARLLSLSVDPTQRNFTLGQGLWGNSPTDLFDVRLRTTATDANGTPSITTNPGTAKPALTHVVYTRRSDGAVAIFVDGAQVKSGTVGGNLTNWDAGYRLHLAGEGDNSRHWLGDLHLAAVYCRALDGAAVQQNFAAGIDGDSQPPPPDPTATPDGPNQRPIADAGPDVTVTDSDGSGSEIVALSGAGSSDPDGQIVQYRWRSDTGVAIADQMESSGDFPVGVHTVDLIVTDDDGATKRDTLIVTVNPGDASPPAPTPTPDGGGTACDVAPTNLLRNPGFEDGSSDWLFYTNGSGRLDITDTDPAQCVQAAAVVINQSGSNVQLYQRGARLEAGARYRLAFSARSNVNRVMQAYVQKDNAPYTNYGLSENVALTSDWQRYELEFTATGFAGSATDTRLRIWLVSARPGRHAFLR